MRRTTAAVVGPLLGTALLLLAKLGVDQASGAPLAADPAATAGPASGPSGVDGPIVPGASGSTASAAPTAASGPTATPRSSASRPAATATRGATAGGLRDGTHAGSRSTNKYGTIQVTITVSGGRMTAVTVAYPTSPSKTADINAGAIPRLKQQALAAQSANVSTVSGATYTSRSFVASLQSALTAAKS